MAEETGEIPWAILLAFGASRPLFRAFLPPELTRHVPNLRPWRRCEAVHGSLDLRERARGERHRDRRAPPAAGYHRYPERDPSLAVDGDLDPSYQGRRRPRFQPQNVRVASGHSGGPRDGHSGGGLDRVQRPSRQRQRIDEVDPRSIALVRRPSMPLGDPAQVIGGERAEVPCPCVRPRDEHGPRRRLEEVGGRAGAEDGRAATDAAAAINRTAAPRPSTMSALDRVTRPIIRILLPSLGRRQVTTDGRPRGRHSFSRRLQPVSGEIGQEFEHMFVELGGSLHAREMGGLRHDDLNQDERVPRPRDLVVEASAVDSAMPRSMAFTGPTTYSFEPTDSTRTVHAASRSGKGSTPMPGPVGTAIVPSEARTNGSVMSSGQ